ncbi:MAG: threonine synthase [Alphaproteobacteria bacterium]
MDYVSTRGQSPALDFEDVLLAGVAPDGGLYVPAAWPRLSPDEVRRLAGLPYAELAERLMAPFVNGALDRGSFARLVREAYAVFGHAAVAPLKQIGTDEWLLELFHGPTLAFKDFPLQLLARLLDHVLARRGMRVTVVGATSGDTGSAAIAGLRDRPGMEVFILHPKGRISEVQRRQMTTVSSPNIHNLAIEGTFDDCQALVKALFADATFRQEMTLAAFNSMNWARVMAQVVYYFAAALALGAPERAVAFSVPTGNFGDVFAGYAARAMGLPVKRFIVATNRNDILARFFVSGEYRVGTVHPTLSPAMDIQVASNFERLLYESLVRDSGAVTRLMRRLGEEGGFQVDEPDLAELKRLFASRRVDDDETVATIRAVYREVGEAIDPHTAVGVAAARAVGRDGSAPMVVLATAHPAKFPEAVARATGLRPALPPQLSDLYERPERYEVLPNDLGAVQAFLRATTAKR